ncbi:unnamed protein product, partial [Mesorhabditis belari]|uniref:AMP-dependent synthetase/ligase domain-containing protein n=1 Tax=Mesorhabditis belari TaxID=2138241 RepID=A0AAF3EBL6_9BILA
MEILWIRKNYMAKSIEAKKKIGKLCLLTPSVNAAASATIGFHFECPFCFIPRKIHACDYGVSWLIREDGLLEKVPISDTVAKFPNTPIAYRISTTGTTGKPKQIDVPWTAIMPNIVDFRDKFGVTREDRVLFSTSFQFDPSIIELFLPAFTGSQLIIASEAVRSSSTAFLTLFAQTRPTIVQLTPAILTILGQTVLDQLFA